MGMSMIEFIDRRISGYCSDPTLYDVSPFSLADFRDCFIMELIKDAYHETAPRQSLRALRGRDDDDARMRDSRIAKYAQHYRTLQFEHIKSNIGWEVPELLPDDVRSINGRLEGYHFTEMQYFELNTMVDHPLFKAIVNKRICDVKKISNNTFRDFMADYESLTQDLLKRLDGSDEDVIFATIALFTLEWKYCVELLYSCAVNSERTGTKDVPLDRFAALCAQLAFPIPPEFTTILHTESRFVLHRMSLVPVMFSDSDWEEVEAKLCVYLTIRYYLKQEIIHKWSLPEYFCGMTTRAQWASFIREHYDLRKIYTRKDWTNSRIRYVRNLYQATRMEQETPKL